MTHSWHGDWPQAPGPQTNDIGSPRCTSTRSVTANPEGDNANAPGALKPVIGGPLQFGAAKPMESDFPFVALNTHLLLIAQTCSNVLRCASQGRCADRPQAHCAKETVRRGRLQAPCHVRRCSGGLPSSTHATRAPILQPPACLPHLRHRAAAMANGTARLPVVQGRPPCCPSYAQYGQLGVEQSP